MIRLFTALLLLWPLAATADTIVPPQAFEELSTGKTFYFFRNGTFFGAEQYFPGRRTLWQFKGGECQEGNWFFREDLICFAYQEDPRIQCWYFIEQPNGYIARGEFDPPELDLELGHIDTQPLNCPAPDVGV